MLPLDQDEDVQSQTEYLVNCLVDRLNKHAPYPNVIDGAFSYKTNNPKLLKTIKLWGDKWEKEMLDGNE